MESYKAISDTDVISGQMKKLNFEIHKKTTTTLFKTIEVDQNDGNEEVRKKQAIDIESCEYISKLRGKEQA